VTARAIGDLAELIELAFPLLSVGGRLIAWKKQPDIDAEIRMSRRVLGELGDGEVESRPAGLAALPDHRLVIATKHGATPPGFPRDPGVRKRGRP
jgi:16S rRNA G527 N7-methylase RsmG